MGVYLFKYSGTNIYFQAAKKLIDVLSRSLRERKKTLLLLSGGSVIALYPKLAKFTQLKIAQVDERFQPENKDDVNAEAIAKTGFLLPYYKVRQDTTLAEAARGYDNEISKLMEWADYKVAVLGIGEDCHTAGLIPGYKDSWNKDSFVVGYTLTNDQKFRQRITVTPKLVKQLDYALVVAIGEKKKTAIQNALKKENLRKLNKFPEALIQKIKKVDLYTDIIS